MLGSSSLGEAIADLQAGLLTNGSSYSSSIPAVHNEQWR